MGRGRAAGSKGEDLAAVYIRKQGYRIIRQNYWTRIGEVDLIVEKDQFLVFVEVKYWKNIDLRELEYSITRKKQNGILRVSRKFLAANQEYENRFLRFDIIFIDACRNIHHIEDAFAETTS